MNEKSRTSFSLMNLDRLQAAEKIETLLSVKYGRDFFLENRDWGDYLESIGCFSEPDSFFKVIDPEGYYKSDSLQYICIPEDLAFKVLVLGGFP